MGSVFNLDLSQKFGRVEISVESLKQKEIHESRVCMC